MHSSLNTSKESNLRLKSQVIEPLNYTERLDFEEGLACSKQFCTLNAELLLRSRCHCLRGSLSSFENENLAPTTSPEHLKKNLSPIGFEIWSIVQRCHWEIAFLLWIE